MNCQSAFKPGDSGLPYYRTSICVRSCCNWRASCVDSKPKKKISRAGGEVRIFGLCKNKQTNKQKSTLCTPQWRDFPQGPRKKNLAG